MKMIEKFVVTLEALFQRHVEARADFLLHRQGLRHHVGSQISDKRVLADVGQRGMHQRTDRLYGGTPANVLEATRPILILDEPQNMESALSRDALLQLAPLFALRYSATHRNAYNLVYRLSPYEAYRLRLVKSIAYVDYNRKGNPPY